MWHSHLSGDFMPLCQDRCGACAQVDWGKGRALAHMLVALGLEEADDVVPIYLGDDRTDEDAFKVLKERSTGLGILISSKVRSAFGLSTHIATAPMHRLTLLFTSSHQAPQHSDQAHRYLPVATCVDEIGLLSVAISFVSMLVSVRFSCRGCTTFVPGLVCYLRHLLLALSHGVETIAAHSEPVTPPYASITSLITDEATRLKLKTGQWMACCSDCTSLAHCSCHCSVHCSSTVVQADRVRPRWVGWVLLGLVGV